MSVWGRIFAVIYDHMMAKTENAGLSAHRRALLAAAAGDVLEIGAGTGTNLLYYGDGVRTLTFTEPEKPMVRRLQKRILERRPDAKLLRAPAGDLPLTTTASLPSSRHPCSAQSTTSPAPCANCAAFYAQADGCCSSSTSAQTTRSSHASRTA
jgi:hypothetical protein